MAKIDVTNSMISEAMDVGTKTGLFGPNPKREDVVKLIQSVLSLVGTKELERFNCRVASVHARGDVRGRIVGPDGSQRGYFVVETEDGRQLHVHGNELFPYSTYKAAR